MQDRGHLIEHPLSYGQRALWFLHLLAPGSAAYNLFFAMRVLSTPNVPTLRAAFQTMVDRHPSLRTTYTTRGGKPVQQVHERLESRFDIIDASTWSADDFNDRLIEQAHRPFDLERGPLFRVVLFLRTDRQHVLLLAAHHIAIDLYSLVLLMDELRQFQPDYFDGALQPPPPHGLQYTDYVRWQAEMLASLRGQQLWDYWHDRLGGEMPQLDLPLDHARPPVQTYRGASHSFKLGEELTSRINALSKSEQASVYMVLLGIFQVLLYRYTGQSDILIGSPASGRTRSEFKGIVGYFVNPLVLRADLSGDPTFVELLRRVRQTVLGALKRQNYPFPLLIERLQPARDPARSPLFQVMFLFQKPHGVDDPTVPMLVIGEAGASMKLAGHDVESFPLKEKVAQFDLELVIVAGNSLSCALHYNADLFDHASIARMSEHFRTLAAAITADPDARVSDLPLLTEDERHQLLSQWNDTQANYPHDRFVHHLFEAQAERAPEALALSFQDEAITYRELNRRSNCLAHHMRRLGVGPEKLVGIYMRRSIEMVVAMLAVLKAGGAYLPLDPLCPKERLAFMMAEADPLLLLSQSHLAGELIDCGARVLSLDGEWLSAERQDEENLCDGLVPANLAYVIYTSGSTGRPKGVMISHRNLNNFLAGMSICFGPEAAGVWLALTNVCFDISILELLWTLTRGFHVVIHAEAEEEAIGQDYSIPAQIARHQVSHLQCTPSMARMLLLNPQAVSALRSVGELVIGGEALQPSLAEELLTAARGEVRNMYGPTETTIWSTTYLLGKSQSAVPIGRPISNTQIYILDRNLHPVPVGVPGELHIGGDGLARGYLHHPDLTADRFIPDCFGEVTGRRLYKTGDLARYLADGNVEFLGRIDHQVKVRGYRVEPGEVDAALTAHTTVREAVTIAHEHAPGQHRLVSYLLTRRAVTDADLRDFLKQKLPEYMIPALFIRLQAMPLTPGGKVNRKALPEPMAERAGAASEYVAPKTNLERAIASVWKEVLQIERVGAQDNFFDLGGHSLLMAQAQSKLRDTLNVDVPMVELFKSPTVSSLARRLSQEKDEQSDSQQLSDRARGRKQAISRHKKFARGGRSINE